MAIAVPFLMSATGASAAIGAAIGISATAVSAITAVTFAVTGLNEKINKAAAKVFGEDLVKIGNLFGTAYAAFNGGFDIGGGGEVATAGEIASKAALDGTDAFGANSASNAFNLSDMASGGDFAGAGAAGSAAQDLMSQADGIAQMGGDAAEFLAASNPGTTTNVVDAVSGGAPEAPGTAVSADTVKSALPDTGAISAQQTGAQAAAADAAGTQATAAVQGPGQTTAAAGQRSFFDKLVYGKNGEINPQTLRMGGNLLAGIGQGYAGAQAAKQKQAMFDAQIAEERRRQSQTTGVRVTR